MTSHHHNVFTSGLGRSTRLAVLAGLVSSLGLTAQAVGPNVDAGALLKRSEQDFKVAPPPPRILSTPAKPSPPKSSAEATVFVKGVDFVGHTLLNQERLNEAVEPYMYRALSMSQLQEVADGVMRAYREAGWLVNAYLPKQEITAGRLTIQVVEATFGGAAIAGPSPQRIKGTRLVDMAEASLVKGKPVNAAQLDRTLLLLDDLPGVSVAGHLAPGARDGETKLLLAATDDALFTGHAALDNQGSRATGSDRLSVNLSLNSPARLGDAVNVHALKTQGSDYQRLSYSVPVNHDGWRAGLHASNLSYQVITPEFASLNPNGSATTHGWNVSYPWLRSQQKNVNFSMGYDDKRFENISNGAATAYAIRSYNTYVNASVMDNWSGGGVTNASVGITTGHKETESRYRKISLTLSRLQSMNDTLSAYAAVSAQTANTNLDSSEKMYLGGATGVRAYPASEAGGSLGNTLNLELRQRINSSVTLTGFYDRGQVKVNRDNNITSPASPNVMRLQGYGLTAAWQATPAMDFKTTLAQRMGGNPAANSTTGLDSDGTKKVTRVWLSSSIAF